MVETLWKPSPNFRPLTGVQKLFIVDHWMVGTLAGTTSSFLRKSFKVATNFGVGQNAIHQYVLEKDYAKGSGTSYANTYGISIEHEGGWLLKDGTRAKPTDDVHELSAQLHADLSRRHGLGRLEVGRNVFPHNHFVATQCPGDPAKDGLDLERIVRRANELLGQPAATPAPAPAAKPAPAPAASTGVKVDGIWGDQSQRATQRALGVTVDGVWGDQSEKALQRKLGVPADGYFGPVSIKALQKHLRVVRDGVWGPQTTTALQRRLNAGTF